MAGRGRPAKEWKLNELEKFAKHLSTDVKNMQVDSPFYRETAERIAENILADVARRSPRYNNYSGNLNRSYMAAIRSGRRNFTYLVSPDITPMPQVTMNRRWSGRLRFKGEGESRRGRGRFAKVGTGAIRAGQVRYFRLTLKRHSQGLRALKSKRGGDIKKQYESAKRNRFVRLIKAMEQQFRSEGYMHQYTQADRRAQKGSSIYRVPARNTYAQISITNLTPYAGFVEAHGYRVIDSSRKAAYADYAKKEFGQAVETSIKWLCEKYNRDTRGRFTGKR